MDGVVECHHVAGGDVFILKLVAGSVGDLGRVVEKLLDFGVPTTSIVVFVAGGVVGAEGGADIAPDGRGSV